MTTQEKAKWLSEFYAEVAAGKQGEYQIAPGGPWNPLFTGPNLGDNLNNWRLKPAPVYRPWTAEEVPINAVYRLKDNATAIWHRPYACDIKGLGFKNTCITFLELLAEYEHSLDGKTWLPCGVEVIP